MRVRLCPTCDCDQESEVFKPRRIQVEGSVLLKVIPKLMHSNAFQRVTGMMLPASCEGLESKGNSLRKATQRFVIALSSPHPRHNIFSPYLQIRIELTVSKRHTPMGSIMLYKLQIDNVSSHYGDVYYLYIMPLKYQNSHTSLSIIMLMIRRSLISRLHL